MGARAYTVIVRSAYLLSAPILVLIAIVWLDRPVSSWVHLHSAWLKPLPFKASYQERQIQVTLPLLLVTPAEFVNEVCLGGIVVLGLAWWSSGRLTGLWRVCLTSCIATSVALGAKEKLKFVFGRTWPTSWAGDNPSWIHNGVYGFNFFHSGLAFQSFPSGHAAGLAAFMIPFWRAYPRTRPLCIALFFIVATGLVSGNYHFLSDVIAGGDLGAGAGILCSGLITTALPRARVARWPRRPAGLQRPEGRHGLHGVLEGEPHHRQLPGEETAP